MRLTILVGPNELRALGRAIGLTLSFNKWPAAPLADTKALARIAERAHDLAEERLSQVGPETLGPSDATLHQHTTMNSEFIPLRAQTNRP